MTQTAQTSPLDAPRIKDLIVDLIEEGCTNATIVREIQDRWKINTSLDSIRRFRQRHGLEYFEKGTAPTSFVKISGDEASASSAPQKERPDLNDLDGMLRERGLDPEEWFIDTDRGVQLNEWGKPDDLNYQCKFVAKKFKSPIIQPVRSDGWKRPALRQSISPDSPELVVICGDQQAPFQDPGLHELFCHWLEVNAPDRGVILGDFIDLPDLSRHPDDPENHASAQECLQSGYEMLRDYVDASVETEWDILPGNHDERIRQYLLKNAPRAYGIQRVDARDEAGNSIYSLNHLMRLDELGMNFIEPYGTYEDAQVTLSKHLAVRHGWIVRQGSGASALKTLEQTGYSIVVGHTHRQSVVHHTVHDIDRKATTLMAAEAGCMCRVSGRDDDNRRFPAYSVLPDWQQGFCTALIWPDGKFRLDLATYVNGVLMWQDQRYE